ncbi:ATP-binding cassette domain-containing protein [Plasticicumulans acidivorans]|uniref:Branched-chain amino acid transport system permease protein n=1 Tax=Plasticicumulans acidivorans TaxID=886464 RepID=A0A317MRY1_9GAMM|nr:branched-chain amino acid ABC transporter ATP-binding protein/permease [Plasticicumulans acidivorans]PWV59795.1 branched-chain amino acid transport system permease protein [Plasticicumulans acidivorans]
MKVETLVVPAATAPARRRWGLPLALLLIAVLPLLLPQFQVTLFNYIGLSSLVCMGLVLLTGIGGLTSFGQAAFVGIAAYLSAWLGTAYGVSPWLTLPLALIVTALTAWSGSLLTLRLSGHYLPLGTLAWGISVYYLFGNLEFLGGHGGLSGIPSLELFGFELREPSSWFWLIWSIVLLSVLAIRHLLDSRPGRAIRALKGGVVMAESCGVDTRHYKTAIFILAALLAALSGWLYAHMQRFVNPTPFGIHAGIEYLFMIVVGGAGYVWGALLGAALITLLKTQLQDWLPLLFGQSGNFEGIVFGVLIIVVLLCARDGLWPALCRWWPWRRAAGITVVPPAEPLPLQPKPARGEPLLDVAAARKEFGGLVAVRDMDFRIAAGEIVGLLGPNGAGKSTMFNLISGVLDATSGEIRFRGERIDQLPSREILARGIGRTFQHVRLIPEMSVLENVAIGAHSRLQVGIGAAMLRLDREAEARLRHEAARQIERVGLAEDMHRPAGSLSLGQQRIVEIARALATDPLLLLLDEPAAGLRHLEKQALAEVLDRLRGEGMSVLIVEHDMDFVMNLVDRLVVMEFGQKLAEGLPLEIQNNPAVLEAYLGGVE